MSVAVLDEQIDQLRARFPQAGFAEPTTHDEHLIIVPGIVLPKGWNKTICTALFLTRVHQRVPKSYLDGFWVDVDLRLEDGRYGEYSRSDEEIRGFPHWKDLTRFWWHPQFFDPYHDTLFTCAMLIRMRLKPAR